MNKKEMIEILERQIERTQAWEQRMIEEYGRDSISDDLLSMGKRNIEYLQQLIEDLRESGKTERRKGAAAKATEARSKKAREAVYNARRLLLMQGDTPTPYKVAKTAQISYQTAKKYLSEFD